MKMRALRGATLGGRREFNFGRRAGATVFGWLAMSLVALVATPAQALSGMGVLTGKIEDAATKAPIGDVLVTVTSPSLQGEQLVVTDASGQYRLPNLPPGVYQIRLEREAYKPFVRDGIQLRADVTLRLDVPLLPEGLVQEEVVVARAPTVDVGSSATGVSVDKNFVSRIPVAAPSGKGGASRSFESIAEVAPGAHVDTYGASVSGTTSPENQYVIDGLSVNNAGYGVNGSPLSLDFIDEVNVITGGYMPEYGRAMGGLFNVVTKSGGNEFHGSVVTNITPGFLQSQRTLVRKQGHSIATQPTLNYIGDIGFELGGPIIKDKLWFYTGVNLAQTSWNLARGYYDDTQGPAAPPLDGSVQNFGAGAMSMQAFSKLTYTVDSSNRLILTFFATPTQSGGGDQFGIDPLSGTTEVFADGRTGINGSPSAYRNLYQSGAMDTSLRWTSDFLEKHLLLENSIGWHHEIGGTYPADGSTIGSHDGIAGTPLVIFRRNNPGPHVITDFEPGAAALGCEAAGTVDGKKCPVTTYNFGGPGQVSQQLFDRYAAKSSVSLLGELFGHHVVKAGVDADLSRFDHWRAYTGGLAYREGTGGTTFTEYRQYGYLKAPDEQVILDSLRNTSTSITAGAYVQDSWNLFDVVTLNFGVRYDAQYLFGGDGKLMLAMPNQISPRVGVIYDPTQSGRSKLFASYSRYYENVPLGLADRAAGEPTVNSVHDAKTCQPNDPKGLAGCASGAGRINNPNVSPDDAPASPDQKWLITGGGKTPVDPSVQASSSDEVVLGAEYEVLSNARIGAQYTKRWLNAAIEDMSRDEGQSYFIGNPGKGIASDFPEAVRDYDAVTAYFQKTYSRDWLAQVSYTWSSLRGNYAGLFRPETGQLDPNINSDFDLRSLTVNRMGPLPGDRTHSFKVFAARDLPIVNTEQHINLGASFRVESGTPSNFLASHPVYGADEVFILPRGSGERLPWVADLDLHAGYELPLWKGGTKIAITVDVFNLFNFQTETRRDNRFTVSDVLPIINGQVADLTNPSKMKNSDNSTFDPATKNPNFGAPLEYQDPRTVRFGIRASF
jgi:hypothetical protein